MKFKLLHVKPHIWFHKQKEAIAKPDNESNSSSSSSATYKRSTSLKLIRKPGKDSITRENDGDGIIKPSKDVQEVCTVVDAGCTCRATLTSQQRNNNTNKKVADAAAAVAAAGVEAIQGAIRLRPDVVSRLICKSSKDVIEVSDNFHGIHHQHQQSHPHHRHQGSLEECRIEMLKTTCPDVDFDHHHRLRNAELERRILKLKKSRDFDAAGAAVAQAGMLSPDSTSASASSINTSTITGNTVTTSDFQDLCLDSASEIVPESVGDQGRSIIPMISEAKISLAELRASITEKKRQRLLNRVKAATAAEGNSDSIQTNAMEECVKHVDVNQSNTNDSIAKCLVEDNSAVKNSIVGATIRTKRFATSDNSNVALLHGNQADVITAQFDARMSLDTTGFGIDDGCEVTDDIVATQFDGRMSLNPADEAVNCNAAVVGKKQVVALASPFSCEIQVPSDYDSLCFGGYTDPLSSPSSSSNSSSVIAATEDEDLQHRDNSDTDVGNNQGMVKESGAVAMVKSSYDPRQDFKDSMLEMVVARRLRGRRQLRQLLQCYLSLNSEEYHSIIVKVFHELCTELFHQNYE